MELLDYVQELGGEYARLLLFIDQSGRVATELGETAMARDLHKMAHEVSARLVELTHEIDARIVPGTE